MSNDFTTGEKMSTKDISSIQLYLDENLEKEVAMRDRIIDFITENSIDTIFTELGAAFLSSVIETREQSKSNLNENQQEVGNELKDDAQTLNLWLTEQSEKNSKFQEVLRTFLQQKGYADDCPKLYKKINMDRRLFARISSEAYELHIDKKTVFKLVIGLELEMAEADRLLNSAGYCFNNHKQGDLIIKYCVQNNIYDPMLIDEYLVFFGEDALFSIAS